MQLNDFNTLFGDVLRRAETSLQSNLQNVSLRLGTAHDIGGIARTVGSEVAVSYEALQRPKIDLDFILAHELAHVAQKRLGAAPTGAAHLEDEADVVAAAILEGRSVTCYLADIPARPAFYEELGHYYTCYYVMLAAGVDPMGARIRAFFAQLPDEVIQFDATSATRDYNEYGEQDVRMGPMSALAGVGGFFSGIPRATPEYEIDYETEETLIDSPNMGPRTITTRRERSGAMAARQQRDQSAIQGLHCLTDRSSHDETTFRLKTLKENWNDPVYSGLALHPFGDSFSHRKIGNEKEMYGSHHGHALDFHKPDYVPDRPRLYLDYAKTLYDTLCALTGGNKAPFSVALEYPLTRVIQAGCGFNGADAEAQCLKEMKTTLMCRIGFDPSYAPEDFVGKYWRDFASQHSDFLSRREIGGAANVRAKIEMAGRTWRERRAKVPALSVAL